jgi:hypothetical protein
LGGLDIEMPGPPKYWGEKLLATLEAGEVPEEVVDAKLRRLLRLAGRVGALDATTRGRTPQPSGALARRAAAEAFVLLRNDGGLLPLAGVRRVAVLGPLALRPEIQGGGAASLQPQQVVAPLEALHAALGPDVEVVHEHGYAPAILPRLDLSWLEGGSFTVDYLDGSGAARRGSLPDLEDAGRRSARRGHDPPARDADRADQRAPRLRRQRLRFRHARPRG